VGAVLLAACLPRQGWQRTDRRACEPQSPPIVCLTPHVEGPYELHVGDAVLLPGECLQAPPEAGSGRLAVTVHASGEALARPRIRLAEGVRTIVRLDGKRVRVLDEQPCDGRVLGP
jgi:hypothetical protein